MPRLLLLVDFSRRRLAELLGARVSRLYGLGLAASFALMVVLLPGAAPVWAVSKLLVRELTSASWIVAGLAALSAARDLEQRDRDEGALALAAQRGHAPAALELSRVLATAGHIAFWVGVPALVLAVLGWFKVSDLTVWRWALAWIAFVVVYALALGLVLGVLARVAARASRQRGRTVLVVLILVPELVRVAWPVVPSVPSAFAWALARAGGTPS